MRKPRKLSVEAAYLIQEGDKAAGIAELEKLVHDNPKVVGFRTKLVAAYWVAVRRDAVETLLNTAIKNNAKDLDAYLQRAEMYQGTHRYRQAEADLDKLRGFRPDSALVHWVTAKLNQARGADLTYRQELMEAIRLDPAFLPARLELAQRLTANGSPDSALKNLDEPPPQQKNNVSVLLERNWALLSLKKFDELKGSVKAELAIARPAELLIQDDWLKIQERNYTAAQTSLDEALKKAPSDVRGLNALVALYAEQKQPGNLEKRLQQLADESRDAGIKYFVGNWLLQKGDRAGAKNYFEAAKPSIRISTRQKSHWPWST